MTGSRARGWWLAALGMCLVVAGVLARFASDQPDGLERVAQDHGIAEYAVEGSALLDDGHTAAVLLGLGVVLVATSALTWSLRRRTPVSRADRPDAERDPLTHGR